MQFRNLVFLVVLFFAKSFFSQESDLKIVQKPIDYSEERIRLSLDYMKDHHNIAQKNPTIVPQIIVLHYTAGGTLETNFNYFNKTYLENRRGSLKKESPLNVSSQFIVDRDGTVYQLMKPNQFARHTIGLNYCAIGVENIGSKTEPLTQKQVEANAKLVEYLKKKYNTIQYLIGHSEYGTFRNSKLWKESNPNYFTVKDDPGADFMRKVRVLVKDLKLKSEP